MINLPPKRIEYLDREAFRIIGLMKDFPIEKKQSITTGSAKEKPIEDWSDKVVKNTPTRSSTITVTGEKIEWIEFFENRSYGFKKNLYKIFKKLVKAVEKDKLISNIASYKFIEEKSFDWFTQTYRLQKAECNFSDYIINEILSSIKEYEFYFPVLNIDIETPFELGKTKITYHTKDQLDKMEDLFYEENPENRKEDTFRIVREQFQGVVFITYKVKAEYHKAEQIALEECSLSIDTLKMCSITTQVPNYRLSFDIDSRATENLKNMVASREMSKPNAIFFSYNRRPNYHKIDREVWNLMSRLGLNHFHIFLKNREKNGTELNNLIINSIKRYANAVTKVDLHQRVVELFTILEALLLKSENVPIIDSVCKYCSKLIFKSIDERLDLIKLLKSMYSIRSEVVHHAKKSEIDLEKLRKLQVVVILLLIKLIEKSNSHKTKLSLLEEIDIEILKAY